MYTRQDLMFGKKNKCWFVPYNYIDLLLIFNEISDVYQNDDSLNSC
jgi:hypothetical protein